MTIWQAALWGCAGVALFQAAEALRQIEANPRKRLPWLHGTRQQRQGYVIGVVLRLVAGGGLDAVYAAAHQLGGPLAAVTMGISAPAMILGLRSSGEERKPADEHRQAPGLEGTANVD